MCVNLRLIYVGLLTFTMVIPSGWGWAQEQSAETSEPPKPPPDEFVWESEYLTRADVRVLEFDSLGDDASLFSISKHKQIFKEMVFATADNEDSNCSRQLVQAIYLQDIGHFFDATAHFDNCTFDGSIDYIESLLGEADDLGAIVKSCVWADHAAARSWRSPSTNLTLRMISARWFDPSSFLHFL